MKIIIKLILIKISLFNFCLAENQIHQIGAMLCLSGDCAEYGTNALNGAQLAIDQINANGGILGKKLKLIVQDSQDTKPTSAVAALRKLLENKSINFILGPTWSVAGMAVAPQISKSEVIVTSPSVGIRDFNESSENILNVWPHDEIATRKLAAYAIKQGYKTAAILGAEDPWVITQSNIFDEEFKKLGGQILIRFDPLPDERELRSEVMKIKAAQPDVIFFSNYQTDVISKIMRSFKMNTPKLAILMEKERVKSSNGALDGTVFALYEEAKPEFQKAFIAKYQADPGISADTAYDAIKIYAKAASETKSFDRNLILEYLLKLKDYPGVSGKFSFNTKGSVNKKPVLWEISNSEYRKLDF